MYDISIIIPVFNTAKYLEKCIYSVINNLIFDRCQVIIIDDCSTDNSFFIINKFANSYNNISAFQCKNKGLSTVRNIGISLARGKYIFFLDSDDYITPDYLKNLYDKAKKSNCDIVYSGYTSVLSNGQETSIYRPILKRDINYNGIEWLNARMNFNDWHNQACCALYKSSMFENKQLKFRSNLTLYEDIFFSNNIAVYAERIGCVNNYGYMYLVRDNSLVHNKNSYKRDIEACLLVLNQFEIEYNSYSKRQSKAIGRVLYQLVSMILYFIGELNLSVKNYYDKLKSPELIKILENSSISHKEKFKLFIFKHCMPIYYHLVKKVR